MRAIFISYRRDDTEGHAGRLFEDLCDRFGKASVFMDVAGIEPGRDFRRVIEQQVASCGVLLALIGKEWLTVVDAQGKRRLDDPIDFVRLETAHALKRDIPVIPVLVQNAAMPREEQLPDDLKDLAFRNGVELTHARWNSDVQVLIDALLPYVGTAAAAPPVPVPAPAPAPAPPNGGGGGRAGWLIAPLAVLAAGGIGYAVWDRVRDDAPAAPVVGAAASAGSTSSTASATPAVAPAPAPTPAPAPASAAPSPIPAAAPRPASAAASVPEAPAASRPSPKPIVVAKPPAPAPASAASRPAAPAPPAPPAPKPAPAPSPAPAPTSGPTVLPARQEPGSELFGSPGTLSMVTRTIVIKPGTTFVNVTGGEIIRFDVGDKSFVWNFNGQRSSFDLARIAPASVLDRKVTAYVAPNPMYPRRN